MEQIYRAVANGPVGSAMAGPIIEPVIKKNSFCKTNKMARVWSE